MTITDTIPDLYPSTFGVQEDDQMHTEDWTYQLMFLCQSLQMVQGKERVCAAVFGLN